MDQIKNFAKVTVDPNGNYDSSSTSIDLITDDAIYLPTTPFDLVWWNATDFPDSADDRVGREIVRVTNITGDTLTVTRAQQGTSASDKNAAGKTYKMAECFTRQTILDMVGDVFGSGTALLVDDDSETLELRQSATKGVAIASGSTTIEDTTSVDIGDPIGNGNSTWMSVSDQNQRVTLIGMDIATDRTTSATVAVGTLVAKLAIRDGSGTIIGYLPIYGSIT